MKDVATYVDKVHISGKVVVSKMVKYHILTKFGVSIHRTTIGRMMKRLGLVWSNIKPVAKTYAAYQSRAIQEYLISLDKFVKQMNNGDNNYVLIFTDDSYISINHSYKNTFQSKNNKTSNIRRKSGKWRRLNILHTIGEDGPLVMNDDMTGIPIDELQ